MPREYHKDGSYTDRSGGSYPSTTYNQDGSIREQTHNEKTFPVIGDNVAVTRDGEGNVLHAEKRK